MALQTLDLWSLVRGRPQIDPNDLAEAVVQQAAEEPLDYRTRLLIRDSVNALKAYWGIPQVKRYFATSAYREKIATICRDEYEKVGFSSIQNRLMDRTNPKTVEQYFRELGLRVRKPLCLFVGGAIAMIARGLLVRHTEDIDVVFEPPPELREQHKFIEELQQRYGLMLAHFEQHYLPSGWSDRVSFYDMYGDLYVYFVDSIDIFLGKLTTKRSKDLDDMRMLAPQLDKVIIVQRLKDTMQSALASEELKERAKKNWYILYGEELPQ